MRLDPTLIVITDSGILARASGMPMADAVRAAAAGGATIIQLREKEMSGAAFLRMADELRAVLDGSGCAFMVNDRLDIALACGAEGVHLGQEDLPLSRAKEVAGGRHWPANEEAMKVPHAMVAILLVDVVATGSTIAYNLCL